MGNDSEYTALASLLDFYSDRAVAHASFLIAIIFGLFTILSLVNIKFRWESLLLLFTTYWGLWGFGLYCLYNFRYYALFSEQVIQKIFEEKSLCELRDEIEKKTKEKWGKRLQFFFDFKAGVVKGRDTLSWWRRQKMKIFFLLYSLMAALPCIAIFFIR